MLLNEPTGVATNIVGLTIGQNYNLSFLVWGDNRPGQAYSLSSSIGSTTFATFSNIDFAPGSSAGTLLSFNFTADAVSETLTLAGGNLSSASPIIDNILITTAVPEPATWAMFLLGFGAIGWMLRANRRKVAATA